MIHTLPQLCVTRIFLYTGCDGIGRLAQTCKSCARLAKTANLWLDLLQNEVVEMFAADGLSTIELYQLLAVRFASRKKTWFRRRFSHQPWALKRYASPFCIAGVVMQETATAAKMETMINNVISSISQLSMPFLVVPMMLGKPAGEISLDELSQSLQRFPGFSGLSKSYIPKDFVVTDLEVFECFRSGQFNSALLSKPICFPGWADDLAAGIVFDQTPHLSDGFSDRGERRPEGYYEDMEVEGVFVAEHERGPDSPGLPVRPASAWSIPQPDETESLKQKPLNICTGAFVPIVFGGPSAPPELLRPRRAHCAPPLVWAALTGQVAACRLLIQNGVDKTATIPAYDATSLDVALANGHAECARFLAQAGVKRGQCINVDGCKMYRYPIGTSSSSSSSSANHFGLTCVHSSTAT